MTIKQRVKSRADGLDLRAATIAKHLGILPQYVNNWFSRDSIPQQYLFDVARYLNCDAEWLATGKGSPDDTTVKELDLRARQTASRVSNLSIRDQALISDMITHIENGHK